MAQKRKSGPEEEIRTLFADDKLVIGSSRTMKLLTQGKLAKVFMSRNCPNRQDIAYACKIANVPLVDLAVASDDIGVICKKPFSISLCGEKA